MLVVLVENIFMYRKEISETIDDVYNYIQNLMGRVNCFGSTSNYRGYLQMNHKFITIDIDKLESKFPNVLFTITNDKKYGTEVKWKIKGAKGRI